MQKQYIIFEKIHHFLSKQFKNELIETKEYADCEEGTHLTISDSGIWLSVNNWEIIMGYDGNWDYYNFDYIEIDDFFEIFVAILTRKKRKTCFFKGKWCYKVEAELENAEGEYKTLSVSTTWLFPFWRKTQTKISIIPNLIDYEEIEEELLKLEKSIQQSIENIEENE
ncbi:MAG: hypothetical protein ACPG5B_12100 [Chitinophagales bacterium]